MLKRLVRYWPLFLGLSLVFAVLVPFLGFYGRTLAAMTAIFTIAQWPPVLAVVCATVGLMAFFAFTDGADTGILSVVCFLLFLALFAGTLIAERPLTAVRYSNFIEETTAPPPTFDERPGELYAANLLRENAGDIGDGSIANVTFLGDSTWSAIVDGRGVNVKLSRVVQWDGQGTAPENFRSCFFPKGLPALSGVMSNDMKRMLRNAVPFKVSTTDLADAYGFCRGDEAHLAVPWVQYKATPPHIRVFGGLSVVKSRDNIEFFDDVAPGQFPGPVYPRSLVRAVENSNAARFGSFSDHFFRRDLTLNPEGVAALQEKSRNPGQLLLDAESRLWAVTPMSRVSSSTGDIIALAVTPVDSAKADSVNNTEIHMLDKPRIPFQGVSDILRTSFASLNWQATGFRLNELAPQGDLWVGTVGFDESPEFSLTVDRDGVVCLSTAAGEKVRCSNERTEDPAVPTGQFKGLETTELLKIRDELLLELDSRLN